MIHSGDRPLERDLLDDGLSLRFLRTSDGGDGDQNDDENEQSKQVAHFLFLHEFHRTDVGGVREFEGARRFGGASRCSPEGARTGPSPGRHGASVSKFSVLRGLEPR